MLRCMQDKNEAEEERFVLLFQIKIFINFVINTLLYYNYQEWKNEE